MGGLKTAGGIGDFPGRVGEHGSTAGGDHPESRRWRSGYFSQRLAQGTSASRLGSLR
jgi:hypothetical protein